VLALVDGAGYERLQGVSGGAAGFGFGFGEGDLAAGSPVCVLSSAGAPSAMTWPWSMTTIRSASSSASSRYWVVSSRVTPPATSSRITFHIRSLLAGSSPVVGSSRNSTGGLVTRPAARSRRRRIPPEYSFSIRSAASVRSNWSRNLAARFFASPRRRPLSRPIMTRFWRPVRTSSTVASCAVTPMLRWTADASLRTSWPATRAQPWSGRDSVVRMRRAVVLPVPLRVLCRLTRRTGNHGIR
jgi:hypothetical protein